jgi:hypothetical protein
VTGFIAAYRALGGVVHLAYLPKWYWQQIGSPPLTPIGDLGVSLVSSAYPGVYSDSGEGWAGYGGLDPAVWQWSDNRDYGGVACDQNAFKGTAAELLSLFRTGKITPPAPAPVPVPVPVPAPAPAEEDDMPVLDSLRSGGPAVCLPVPPGSATVTLYADGGVGVDVPPEIRVGTDPVWTVKTLTPAWGKPAQMPLPKGTTMVTISRVDAGAVPVTAAFT